MVDVWTAVKAERTALADDLAGLDDAAWATPSPCEGWTVRDVLAHLDASARITAGSFLPKLVASGFSLKRLQAKDIAAGTTGPPSATLARFREVLGSTKSPPGPKDTWLGEILVHGDDIRRPLGIARTYDVDACVQVADFYKGSNLVLGSKKRLDGLRLEATDASWSTGSGPTVSGPIHSLLVAMTGRRGATADLTGDGVATLAARC